MNWLLSLGCVGAGSMKSPGERSYSFSDCRGRSSCREGCSDSAFSRSSSMASIYSSGWKITRFWCD